MRLGASGVSLPVRFVFLKCAARAIGINHRVAVEICQPGTGWPSFTQVCDVDSSELAAVFPFPMHGKP